MKSVLISIKPKWCWKIERGEKTIEVRKTAPKEVPFKAYIYCSYGNDKENYMLGGCGKVIGEFICDKVYKYEPHVILCAYYEVNGAYVKENLRYNSGTCLSYEDMVNYSNGKTLYGWHISDLKIYGKPKELREFYTIVESGSVCCHSCVWQETPLFEMPCTTCTGEKKYLYRPPQSWMYVEEIETR
nr:MAG TPA: helix-turn-helix domain-containing protein [Caudoviricetes sp.]